MKTSFLINSHNETNALKVTIKDIKQDMKGEDFEIIVFADGCPETGQDNDVKIIYSEHPIGCGKAKAKLTKAAKGNVLIYLDAHHYLQYGSYKHLIKTAVKKQAIVHPVIYSIEYDANWKVRLKNNRPKVPVPWIHLNCKAGNLLQNVELKDWKNRIHVHTGACVAPYVIPKSVMNKLGGWNEYPYRHGGQELGMALRAIVCGVDRVIDGFTGVGHAFSKNLRFGGMEEWHQHRNQFYAWMVCLTDEEFDLWISPSLEKGLTKKNHVDQIRYDPIFRRQQKELLALRKKLPVLFDKKTFGGWSLDYEMFNWIVQNIPKDSYIVELGSGRTSELLSQRYKLLSIENNLRFIDKYHTNYIHAPLKDNWYDPEKIKEHNLKDYDLLIIDGPYEKVSDRSNLIKHWNLMGKPKLILVDDSNRFSAQKIIAYLCETGYRIDAEMKFNKQSVVLKRT